MATYLSTTTSSKGLDNHIWTCSLTNDFGRILQGVDTCMQQGTNIIFFIPCSLDPKDWQVSYVKPVMSIHPQKAEAQRIWLKVRGDRLDYPGAISIDIASLTMTNILAKKRHIHSGDKVHNCQYQRLLLRNSPWHDMNISRLLLTSSLKRLLSNTT